MDLEKRKVIALEQINSKLWWIAFWLFVMMFK